MIGAEWFRLPSLPEGTPEEQLRAVRNYLYQLSEQLQYAFSHTEEAPDTETLRGMLLEEPEFTGRLAALAGKRLEGQYLSAEGWEADRRKKNAQWAKAMCRLSTLEDREAPERETGPALCKGAPAGYQEQTGERVCFTPLEAPEEIFKKQPDGHWRVE